MEQYKYLIVGGGMAASAAMQAIREADAAGSIAVLSADSFPPYDRPPLSKGLWKDDDPQSSNGESAEDVVVRELPDDVVVQARTVVKAIDREAQTVETEDGTRYGYEKLLLALGGTPKQLPFDDDEQVIYFRTLNDYHRLRQLSQSHSRFVVVGGGFIGSELAAALRLHGKDVTMIFPERSICANLFPADLAGYVDRYYESKGVTLLAGEEIRAIQGHVGNFWIETESGQELRADVVVAGIGIEPNTQLAEDAGLDVDDGILVDNRLRTSDPHIYAAGDAANFFDAVLGERRRVEHEDNALSMGKTAGRIMAGESAQYEHSPMFYSDLFDLGYEAVGKLDSSLDIVADWQEEYEKGVIYYLEKDRVRGVLLWNVWDQVDAARELIAQGATVQASDLIGCIGDWGDLDESLKQTFPASDATASW